MTLRGQIEGVIHKWDNATMTPDGLTWWTCVRADLRSALSAKEETEAGEQIEEVAARAVRTALEVIEHASTILDSIDIAAAPEHDLRNVCDRLVTHLDLAPALIEYAATTQGTPSSSPQGPGANPNPQHKEE